MSGADDNATFASPPCFMHELDSRCMGMSASADKQTSTDVARWRKAERQRLIEERLALANRTRENLTSRIIDRLVKQIGNMRGKTVSIYWPFRGEPDFRSLADVVTASRGRLALPVVTGKNTPLTFRTWSPSTPLERGVWNIPVPVSTVEAVTPDIVIAPVVGFDAGCFRLGYGGGYFDRTLAASSPRPQAIGVGYEIAAIPTIYPQPHDIAMDCIITESRVLHRKEDRRTDERLKR